MHLLFSLFENTGCSHFSIKCISIFINITGIIGQIKKRKKEKEKKKKVLCIIKRS